MVAKGLHIEELEEFIKSAFLNDDDIVSIYDKNVPVNNTEDVCKNVYEKITSLKETPQMRGVYADGVKIGYFVFMPSILISFGININYREYKYLIRFWGLIKEEINTNFQCYLFDYNVRAIQWLKKCGMNILFENVTILQICH